MRMITRCPTCGTGFRVQADQLAARDGRVRCGRCATIFDARATLVTESEAAADRTAGPTHGAASPAARRSDEIAQVEATVSQPFGSSLPPELEISLADDEPEFEFGPRPRRRSPIATVLWALGCVTAVGVLAGQGAYAYRGELALLWPESAPWLAAACHELRCSIPLPQHVDLIGIESSELAPERGGAGVLTLAGVLRNRARFAQAHPALELTLTDAQDRPLARRVLRPQDYLGERAGGEAAFAAGAEVNFRLHIDAAAVGASGYRLYAFYL